MIRIIAGIVGGLAIVAGLALAAVVLGQTGGRGGPYLNLGLGLAVLGAAAIAGAVLL